MTTSRTRGGVFAEVHGQRWSRRGWRPAGHARGHQRAGEQRQDAVLRIGEQRGPLGAGQELHPRDLLKERARLSDEDVDDSSRDEQREAAAKRISRTMTVNQPTAAQELSDGTQLFRCDLPDVWGGGQMRHSRASGPVGGDLTNIVGCSPKRVIPATPCSPDLLSRFLFRFNTSSTLRPTAAFGEGRCRSGASGSAWRHLVGLRAAARNRPRRPGSAPFGSR